MIRTTLFVPGNQPAMIEKAARSGADAVCIDLEDSVSTDQKEASRKHVVRALRELTFGSRLRMVRINALDTPFAERDLVEVLEQAGDCVDAIMLPKAGSARDVLAIDATLRQLVTRGGASHRIRVQAQIETAAGFVWLREIASASERLQALIFGPGDYAASLHAPSSAVGAIDEHDAVYPGHRWHAPMHAIVAHARAFGLLAIDGPYAAFKDDKGFERSCRIARALGYDGKQCIHPAQIPIATEIFSPSPAEIEHAKRVIAACEEAAAKGKGAASLDGVMIDVASVRLAESVLAKMAAPSPGTAEFRPEVRSAEGRNDL